MSSARLVLADGSVFEGRAVGASGSVDGEVVFNTSMTGYQEMLTDPSYAGQLLTLTYPMIGNYGVDAAVEESGQIQPRGLIVREVAPVSSHPRSTSDLATFLAERDVVAIDGVDTRAITRRIRRHGVMLGTVTTEPAGEALERVRALPGYDSIDWASQVSTAEQYEWREFAEERDLRPAVEPKANKAIGDIRTVDVGFSASSGSPTVSITPVAVPADAPLDRRKVVLIDGGVKRNIMRSLVALDCDVTVLPIDANAEDVLALRPDGVLWSPGPGDPQVQNFQVEETRKLIGSVPLFGICLGHQVIARALGAGTFKLPFGHRGGNHPVRDERTGTVTITAQNHGYAVDPDGLADSAEVSHVNLNDGTVEGLRMRSEPVMTIQYHSEASPGPLDSMGMFDRFVELMDAEGGRG
ncbi:MAG: glutamine-hydrolyzing carbamoyl-phosphate synthase small subunit [Dehalococcoidia bacterium]|nr:glutamine-hydrolyzing carbamoyl-phosphate synthase small subunit [Dehalococcoidia bacterium]